MTVKDSPLTFEKVENADPAARAANALTAILPPMAEAVRIIMRVDDSIVY